MDSDDDMPVGSGAAAGVRDGDHDMPLGSAVAGGPGLGESDVAMFSGGEGSYVHECDVGVVVEIEGVGFHVPGDTDQQDAEAQGPGVGFQDEAATAGGLPNNHMTVEDEACWG